jgi:hypothetical protein
VDDELKRLRSAMAAAGYDTKKMSAPATKPMRLSREFTVWALEAEVEQVPNATRLLKYAYEPLETHAPPPDQAEPYCCYLKTVIFYEHRYSGSAIKGITRCEHYNLATAPSPHLVDYEGLFYEVSPDQVLWRNGEWQFRYTLDARERHARLLNLGAEALRAESAK